MRTCPSCGEENPPRARFCLNCATPLLDGPTGREQRKTVTVVFCDVVGSTALGDALDPEALRALLARYFERMKEIVERHGGVVEKFIGDAVMAVFGIPLAHEDDALRACRAGIEMLESLPELRLDGRIGVNTGEVVTGTAERLATGDAVNVAARLQQAAAPGEVLVGEPTFELVDGAVEVEVVEPLTVKGKAQPVPAYRLLAVHEAVPRRHEERFVGREEQLSAVRKAWQQALGEQRCVLVTIVGEAGVGKSRLVAEALASFEAPVVQGRCLPYGEGITYWPVLEVIKQIGALPSQPAAAAALRSLLGESDAVTSAEEIAWAFRKLLEQSAPLIAVFDDIHWGEESFLDLLDHVALLSSGAPLLLLCVARPDLVERRLSWPVTLRLEPLSEEHVDELIRGRVSAGLRDRIAKASGGNPLFLAEMLAMSGEANGTVIVPPTLRALLAARLDQLDARERQVLECGAVEGEVFHRGAVQALALDETQITPRLAALVRKELVRPERAQLSGEDGFRFRHLLIRDTAYDGMPKATRADLHERLARWLHAVAGERVSELDEIIGYHLAQAFAYRAELGAAESFRAVADEACEYLAAAGRRALGRRDLHAAAALLRRARSLAADGSIEHRRLGLSLGSALVEAGAFDKAREVLEQVERAAEAAGDAVDAAHARLDLVGISIEIDPEGAAERARIEAEAAMPVFEAAGDDLGIGKAWRARSEPDHMLARFEPYRYAHERALKHLRKTGDQTAISQTLAQIAHAVTMGPTPIPQAVARLEAILDEQPDDRDLRARVQLRKGFLLAQAGDRDAALEAEAEAEEIFSDLGVEYYLGSFGLMAGDLERFLGRMDRAEQVLRRADAVYESVGERSVRSTALARLAWVLLEAAKLDDAESTARLALRLGSSDDLATMAVAEAVLARIRAGRGEPDAVEASARAVALSEQTDMLWPQGESWQSHAEVLRVLARADEARQALREAIARFERKEATALADRARTRLAAL